jgi:hypothetical protein
MVIDNTITDPNKRSSLNGKSSSILNLYVRDSIADWPAILDSKALEGTPNALVILYDNTGCLAWASMVSVKEFN